MAKINKRHDAHEIFGSPSIQQQLQIAGLETFEVIWALDAEWVEEPNVSSARKTMVTEACETRFTTNQRPIVNINAWSPCTPPT